MAKKSENGNGAADAAPTVDDLKAMNVYQRMLEAQRLFPYVQKDSTVNIKSSKGNFSFKAVSHDAVTKKARDALMACGLYAEVNVTGHDHTGNRASCDVRMTIINVDDPKDRFDTVMFGEGCDSGDKAPGKAISYAVKYCYLKAFGAETGEDADLESVEFEAPKTRAEVGAAISEAVRVNKLDMTRVMERIESTYGEVAEIPLEIMSSIQADIELSPHNWVIDEQPAGVN